MSASFGDFHDLESPGGYFRKETPFERAITQHMREQERSDLNANFPVIPG